MITCCRGGLLVCVVVGLTGFGAIAHDDPPPPPPIPPKRIDAHELKVPRWSWYHWWEANRDRYIWPDRLDQGDIFLDIQTIEKDRKTFRKSAVEALTGATHAKVPALRAMAAIALGRMREVDATARIAELLEDDDEDVQRAAMIALGLIDTAESRDLLLKRRQLAPKFERAQILALGLTASREPRVRERLREALERPPREAERMAAWSLARRDDGSDGFAAMADILRRSPDPWIAAEAIFALGQSGRPEHVAVLAHILLETKEAKKLGVWRQLGRLHTMRQQAYRTAKNATDRRQQGPALTRGYKLIKDWIDQSPNQYAEPGDPYASPTRLGMEVLYLKRLRVSAANALGNLNFPDSRAALVQAIELQDERFGDLYKGAAIMSLGKIGDESTLPLLVRMMDRFLKQGGDVLKPQEELDSPLRGFAALAIGIQLRGSVVKQETEFSAAHAEICRRLAEAASSSQETIEVRSACVLALGLARHPSCMKHLEDLGDAISMKDEPLFGYTLLARGMLGDQEMISSAWHYLADTPDRVVVEGMLGRRATVLGLGLLRSQRGVLLMKKAWELNYYVSREVAFGLSICNDHQVTPVIIDMIFFSEKPAGKVFAAEVLGKLYEDRKPFRTAWFVNGSNYMMRNDELRPFQRLGNEFLFQYLIASFDEDWW